MRTLALAFLAVATCCMGAVAKIGVILPLSGALSESGTDTRDAMLLYLQQHPEVAEKISVTFEDDQSQAKYAALAAQKLINIDKVSALISFYGYGGHAVAPLAEAAKVPHLGLTLDRSVAAGAYSYANFPSAESGAALMADTVKQLGYSSVSIIYSKSQGPQAQVEALTAAFGKTGVAVHSSGVLNSERDLRPVIGRMQAEQAQLWIIILHPPLGDIFLRQSRELGATAAITAAWGFDDVQEKLLVEGKWYIRQQLPSAEFVSAFAAQFHRTPKPLVVYCYDGLAIFSRVLIEANGDRAKAKVALDALGSFSGEAGRYTINAEGFMDSSWMLARFKDGQPQPVSISEIKH